jgi:hypothetical protein
VGTLPAAPAFVGGSLLAQAGTAAVEMWAYALRGSAPGVAAPTATSVAGVQSGQRTLVRHQPLPPGSATPGKVRAVLARGDVAVLLFYSATSPDDRAVRAELDQVNDRGGHVAVWAVSIHGLTRFKNVLRGLEVQQSPTVVILSRRAKSIVLAGYTDHLEIDQATAADLRAR